MATTIALNAKIQRPSVCNVFLVNAPSIKRDFPNLYSYTVYYLYKLDEQEAFEDIYPPIDQELVEKMRAQLFLIEHSTQISPPAFNKMAENS